ncbi:chymotrypsin-like elastase family member 2A [Spodoptera frugiperda]|uniref:Chymotrypsin-like elastase family member 2A n=1 Tax=Spodoptera frugiperda TaxID=7108 RepID=A0A9R0EJE4_SPOFR|nr:chymotrypsin-like elastase family member 2A [Spodoptera frugiperda]
MKIFCIFVLALCGAATASVERVTGGNIAQPNQFPSAVSIQHTMQAEPSRLIQGHVCGGTLVTRLYVLTTGTCIMQTQEPDSLPIIMNQYRVYAGGVNLLEHNVDRIRIPVNITLHRDYIGPPAYVNNLAIIGLNAPFGNDIIPVALPSAGSQLPTMTQCYAAGWGADHINFTESSVQRYVSNYIYDQQICTIRYNLNSWMNILPSMLCAASWDIVSAGCTGDIGNGLICNGTLHGVLSVSNNCHGNGVPEVYVRVADYVPWIREVTGASSTIQPGMAMLVLFAIVQFITVKIIS